jgi:hypothetical protein
MGQKKEKVYDTRMCKRKLENENFAWSNITKDGEWWRKSDMEMGKCGEKEKGNQESEMKVEN